MASVSGLNISREKKKKPAKRNCARLSNKKEITPSNASLNRQTIEVAKLIPKQPSK